MGSNYHSIKNEPIEYEFIQKLYAYYPYNPYHPYFCIYS